MKNYAASYCPLTREFEILLCEGEEFQSKPKVIKVSSVFGLKALLQPRDHFWLMMGSTNASIALAAFRQDAIVHQLSLPRLYSWLNKNRSHENAQTVSHLKVTPEHVFAAAKEAPELFYEMSVAQAEVLEIVAAWQAVDDAMKARKAAANLLRSRVYQEAVVYHRVRGKELPSVPEEAEEVLEEILFNLLDTKDKQRRKRLPQDSHIAFLVEEEERQRARLERICHQSTFYNHMFGDVRGVGPALGARFIASIERIERFTRPEDLSNYAGVLPRGKEGRLPSRFRSKGQTLSRSPRLNTACFLLQDFMFQWGRNTELGQFLIQQVERDCPCTEQQRKVDKDLRRRHAGAVKQARIAMTRYFLEKIVWPKWRAYMGLT